MLGIVQGHILRHSFPALVGSCTFGEKGRSRWFDIFNAEDLRHGAERCNCVQVVQLR